MSKEPVYEYEAGGWSTWRGPKEGILLHASKGKRHTTVWIDKTTATRLAHTVLEAQIRFWDILWEPHDLKEDIKSTAFHVGMDMSEPYREGCPFCEYVADSEDEMREHLKDHEITIIVTKEEQP